VDRYLIERGKRNALFFACQGYQSRQELKKRKTIKDSRRAAAYPQNIAFGRVAPRVLPGRKTGRRDTWELQSVGRQGTKSFDLVRSGLETRAVSLIVPSALVEEGGDDHTYRHDIFQHTPSHGNDSV
jgi:hypothetical protein